MSDLVQKRRTLLSQGVSERQIRNARLAAHTKPRRLPESTSALVRVGPGMYVEQPRNVAVDDRWSTQLRALLLQSGSGAAAGLRSAARLHQFDGFANVETVETITVNSCHPRSASVHRSRTLDPADFTTVAGLRCTTVARTLQDLGRVVDADLLEFAVESALRGGDPGSPRVWNEPLLAELHKRSAQAKPRTGANILRRVLMRRPEDAMPTGSYAETSIAQGLRYCNLGGISRQSEIRLFAKNGELIRRFYPDFAILERLVLLEVNGKQSRGGAAMTDSDVRRQNLLSQWFQIHVVSGADAVTNPRRAASDFATIAANAPHRRFPASVNGSTISRTASGLDIFN